MVIRPVLETEAESSSAEPVSAWHAVETAQRVEAAEYWLIPQPAHAALAGDIAAKLRPQLFGLIDSTVARSIALHDAGWGMADAATIQELRAHRRSKRRPVSFVDVKPKDTVQAWSASIETAEKFAAIGGYLVSCHFTRLAQRLPNSDAKDEFQPFSAKEVKRQRRMLTALKEPKEQLERWVDALQLCDLLSLYLCCGARQKAVLRIGGVELEVSSISGEYKLSPFPFESEQQFSFPALSSLTGNKQKRSEAGGVPVSPRDGNAVFYINLAP